MFCSSRSLNSKRHFSYTRCFSIQAAGCTSTNCSLCGSPTASLQCSLCNPAHEENVPQRVLHTLHTEHQTRVLVPERLGACEEPPRSGGPPWPQRKPRPVCQSSLLEWLWAGDRTVSFTESKWTRKSSQHWWVQTSSCLPFRDWCYVFSVSEVIKLLTPSSCRLHQIKRKN